MNDQNPIETLFGKDESISGNATEIIEALGKYGVRNLAYDGDIGCNPGYIFRGEAAFQYPLKSSLERKLCDEFNALADDQLKKREMEIIQEFLTGEGQILADIIEQRNQRTSIRSWLDIWWWLSFMQHYERKTRLVDFTRDIRVALFFAIEQQGKHPDLDIVIYCFPCRDLKHPHDLSSNKCPFRPKPEVAGVDMNLVLGCQIDFPWMKLHKNSWFNGDEPKFYEKNNQRWGWDRPYYQNPRLEFQKGMFVYPYDYPKSKLKKDGHSWLVQNLYASAQNFNLGTESRNLPAKRIRIDKKQANELRIYLKEHFQLTTATIYLDHAKISEH